MPVTYSIDGTTKVIRTTCSSPLTFADVQQHFRTLKDDPACVGRLDVFLDVSEGDTLPATSQLSAVAAELAAVRAKVQFRFCAVVATRDAMFGMMRIFEVLAAQYFEAIHVFRSSAEAEEWLASRRATPGADAGTQPPQI